MRRVEKIEGVKMSDEIKPLQGLLASLYIDRNMQRPVVKQEAARKDADYQIKHNVETFDHADESDRVNAAKLALRDHKYVIDISQLAEKLLSRGVLND